MKKLAFLLSLLLTLTMAASAFAEVVLTPLTEIAGSPDYEDETDYLIVRGDDTRLYGVYNTAGQQLIPCEYGLLSYAGNGYFEAINEDGLNNHALLNDSGEVVIDYAYAAFEMLGGDWCAAVVLEPTEGELYDYSGGFLGGGDHYLVTRYDFYRLSAATQVGSLTRDAYDSAVAHGEYLYVRDRADAVTVFDAAFQPVNVEPSSIYSAYTTDGDNGVCISDGSILTENVTSVSEDYENGYVKTHTRSGMGMVATDGTELIPSEYDSIGMVYEGYATVEKDDMTGLYDLKNSKLIIPCEYDDILYFGLGTINRYLHNGYACVEKDGKVGFVDANGTVTCEPKYAAAAVTQHGCTLTITDMDGTLYLIAGDGTQTQLDFDEVSEYSGGDGSLLIVSKDEAYGVIDWHGNIVLPLEYKSYDIEITDNADAIIAGDTVYAVTVQ